MSGNYAFDITKVEVKKPCSRANAEPQAGGKRRGGDCYSIQATFRDFVAVKHEGKKSHLINKTQLHTLTLYLEERVSGGVANFAEIVFARLQSRLSPPLWTHSQGGKTRQTRPRN